MEHGVEIEGGVLVRLRNEQTILHRPTAKFRTGSSDWEDCVDVVITSHRLVWLTQGTRDGWKVINLSKVRRKPTKWGAFSKKNVVTLLNYLTSVEYSFKVDSTDYQNFKEGIIRGISAAAHASYELPPLSSRVKHRQEESWDRNVRAVTASTSDDRFMADAEQLRHVVRQIRSAAGDYVKQNPRPGFGHETELEFTSHVRSTDADYIDRIADDLSDFVALITSDDKPSSKYLSKYLTHLGGPSGTTSIILLHDLWCLFNRISRGTDPVSPDDMHKAIHLASSKTGSLLNIRPMLDDNIYCIVIGNSTDYDIAMYVYTSVCQETGGMSAGKLAKLWNGSISLATVELELAENYGFLCRDESTEGIFFYENKFNPPPIGERC